MKGIEERRYMKGKGEMIRTEVYLGKLGKAWFYRVEDVRRGITNSDDTSKRS